MNEKLLTYRNGFPSFDELAFVYSGLEQHLNKALDKHPEFAVEFTINDADDVRFRLKCVMITNGEFKRGLITAIQEEERLECESAFLEGDINRAIDEAFDELGVVARKILWLKRREK